MPRMTVPANRASFEIEEFDDTSALTDVTFGVFVRDLDNDENDDIRSVRHPDWDNLFENLQENVFVPYSAAGMEQMEVYNIDPVDTQEKCKAWMLSIGMTEHVEV